jgi:superfamily II DNA or RNA helicase
MDADLVITQVNEVFCKVVCEAGVKQELHEKFTFEVEGKKWHPKVKKGLWDGNIRMFNLRNGHIKKGLIPEIVSWCEDNKVSYHIDESIFTGKDIILDEKDVNDLYKTIDAPYTPKKYQNDAIKHIINNKRSIILSPTASGKSYMLYGAARFYQEMGLKVLIVVHRAALVKQLISENFNDEYDKNRGSFTSHQIYSGKDKEVDADITASTWQSIVNMPESFYKKFDVIIADEVHAWKAMSTVTIMEKCKHIIYRTGVTGTLDDIESNLMSLTGDFGPPQRVASTAELIESKDIANLKIKACLLSYDEKYKNYVSKKCKKYNEEISFICDLEIRNNFIAKLVDSLKGNTLVAFKYAEHGKTLFEKIKTNEKFFINGSVDVDTRLEYQKEMDASENMKGVVSLGTFAEGVNVKNVNYVVLSVPLKSKIKLLQLIGRGLRLSDIKDKVVFIDIGDDFIYKGRKNWSMLHYMERIKRYNLEGFDIEYIKYDIK